MPIIWCCSHGCVLRVSGVIWVAVVVWEVSETSSTNFPIDTPFLKLFPLSTRTWIIE